MRDLEICVFSNVSAFTRPQSYSSHGGTGRQMYILCTPGAGRCGGNDVMTNNSIDSLGGWGPFVMKNDTLVMYTSK